MKIPSRPKALLLAAMVFAGAHPFAAMAKAEQMPSTEQTGVKMDHAHGTFTVKMQPLPAQPDGLTRMSMDKEIHGDLEAVSKGEMITAGDPKQGEAGYVSMERVTGTLGGKTGSFALQQNATMSAGGRSLEVVVVPGSGTGELAGIAGKFEINIANGQHSYDFEYSLPH